MKFDQNVKKNFSFLFSLSIFILDNYAKIYYNIQNEKTHLELKRSRNTS